MTRLHTLLLPALLLPLAIPQVHAESTTPVPTTTAATDARITRNPLARGLYEIAYDRTSASLYAASTGFDRNGGGRIYQLDADTLEVRRELQIDRRGFALGLNRRTHTLFAGNTFDGSVTAIDLDSGAARVFQVATPDAEGKAPHTRKVVVDEDGNRLFVTNPEEENGRLWIVDAADGRVLHTLEHLGKWPTGAAWDPRNKRLYVGHGGSEKIAVIDPDTGEVVTRFDAGGEDAHYFINLALDAEGTHLFASDANTGGLMVFDTADGALLATVPVGVGTLDVLYNPVREEVYLTNRGVSREHPEGSGAVTVIDARDYSVKRVHALPPHPNSLALSEDGQALFVSVKNGRGVEAPESIVRIALD